MLLHKLRAANGLSQCSSSFNILSRTHRPLSSWDGVIQLQVYLIPWVNACSLTWSMCGYITRNNLTMLALTKAAQAFRAITCLLWSLYINDLCDWPAGVKLQRSHIYTGLSSEYSTITLSSRLLILTSVSSCVEVRLYSFIRCEILDTFCLVWSYFRHAETVHVCISWNQYSRTLVSTFIRTF